jgi:hypothetical protein
MASASAVLGTSVAEAQRAPAAVGRALGGAAARSAAGARAKARATLKRLYRGGRDDLGDGPALTLADPARGGTARFLDAQHYRDVRDASLEVMRRYSPKDHYYVAVGRSPVAFATFLRHLNPDLAMTFPASDMRRDVLPEWKEQYFEHFRELIPKDVLEGNRTILLVDRSRPGSGQSLAALKQLLEEYLQRTGSSTQVRALGLAPKGPLTEGVEHLSTEATPNVFLYRRGSYDHDELVAPFLGKHRIGKKSVEELQPNPSHDQFADALKKRMEADGDLDRRLTEDFGDLVE